MQFLPSEQFKTLSKLTDSGLNSELGQMISKGFTLKQELIFVSLSNLQIYNVIKLLLNNCFVVFPPPRDFSSHSLILSVGKSDFIRLKSSVATLSLQG